MDPDASLLPASTWCLCNSHCACSTLHQVQHSTCIWMNGAPIIIYMYVVSKLVACEVKHIYTLFMELHLYM